MQETSPDTLVMASCTYEERAYEAPQGTIAGGQYMGRFTAALVRYLDENKERFNLADLKKEFEEAMEGSAFYIHHQEPMVSGPSYTLVTAHGTFFGDKSLKQLADEAEEKEKNGNQIRDSRDHMPSEKTPKIE